MPESLSRLVPLDPSMLSYGPYHINAWPTLLPSGSPEAARAPGGAKYGFSEDVSLSIHNCSHEQS